MRKVRPISPDPCALFNDAATMAAAGTVAHAYLFPEHGVLAGFFVGMLVCAPVGIERLRRWKEATPSLGLGLAAISIFTWISATVSNTAFQALRGFLEA